MDNEVVCPFCNEPDFDFIGLKRHLLRRDCEVFSTTDSSEETNIMVPESELRREIIRRRLANKPDNL